ncbi:glycoside hydrolase family 97 protein [Flavobacterium hibernum]|uniref:Alpha-glucosidase n=1 Tax=Flavobacterium hibernum TaxID=37752 RepID=A0A0D0ENK8_9FLAO|nr:glycoside hydrolase family 97 protein [Flavobacterium hibernum]KIO54700.1 alpha-glucosidase [Flavobacterium hibernum]OXA85621.1 alpha-glucosidase [Flavobacterium hibernum]STO18454.1 Retaining alpha-galactosidase precursor [Flavobacterium hibernum]
MKNIKYRYCFIALASMLIFACSTKKTYKISSPDKKAALVFELTPSGQPQYSFTSNGKSVIEPSLLGFEFQGIQKMTDGFEVVSTEEKSADETWEQPWGEFKKVRDHHNELIVHLKEAKGEERLVDIIFRVFDDGLGFRYSFPKQPHLDKVKISNEITQFTFKSDNDVWWIPVHRENSYYESTYRKTPISKTDTINTPATFETKEKLFVAIHEANLTDFASMTLLKTNDKQYKSELVPWADGVKVYAETPFKTPWRTIVVGKTAGEVATSTIMLNLNEPSKIEDLSWIRPSKYIGIWWGMHLEKYTWGQGPKHGATTKNTKEYIDFAAKNNFDGVLVEGWNEGWDGDWTADGSAFSFTKAYPDFNLDEITKYAAIKNVRLIGHHETAGATKHYESQLEDAFKLYQKMGVNTVKTGYVNKYLDKKEWHDSQYGARHYRKVMETAAKYHIMIDNHEPIKGTGLQRTYPNFMSQEGGRGQEYNAWSVDGGNTPEHLTTLPFTRMLSGPFDYTPGNFNFDYKTPSGARVQTTLANQLALYVIIYSPLQMASDLPENYEGKPEFQFIKDVPCNWSDTKVLDSKIGEYTTIARKDWEDKNWYLGSITNSYARNLKVDLSFLDKDKEYEAEIYADGTGTNYKTNPYPVTISKQKVNSKTVLDIKLAAGGGTAIKFSPIER